MLFLAGFCGLAVAANFHRRGIPFDIVEQSDALGGNWYNGVYDTVHCITPKSTTQYPEYPMPESYPIFPSGAQVLRYLKDYAVQWGVNAHLITCVSALNIRNVLSPSSSLGQRTVGGECGTEQKGVTNGQYGYDVLLAPTVNVNSGADGQTKTIERPNCFSPDVERGEWKRYKGVVVCAGHHWIKRLPKFPGTFTGKTLHSKDYFTPRQLSGQRVLVVGGGISGCEIVLLASQHGKSACISIDHGRWVLPRIICGRPLRETIRPWWPYWLQGLFIWLYTRFSIGSFSACGLPEPSHRFSGAGETVNGTFLEHCWLGSFGIYPGISHFSGAHVHFVDGSSVEVDTIIFATGFHVCFPMLDEILGMPRSSDLAEGTGDSTLADETDQLLRKKSKGGRLPLPPLAPLYTGVFVPKSKNLMCLGLQEVQYGVGPPVALAADMIARVVKAQEQVKFPVGDIMKSLRMVHILRRLGPKMYKTNLAQPLQYSGMIHRTGAEYFS
eukprot:GHVT01064657.1.p1 GENE.GHVT01064657.1~~GHVT01064657.1.p1  ORF type:complete len:497 (-),score=11.69 GHVT01064657.1:1421-2911(-)